MDDDNYTRITFRMPKPLHAKLQESATATSKSMNAEIIARLESSFDGGDQTAFVKTVARLNHLLSRSEFETHEAEMKLAMLARSLDNAAEIISDHLAGHDAKAAAAAARYAEQAKEYLGREHEIAKNMMGTLEKLVESIKSFKKAGPPEPTAEEQPQSAESVEVAKRKTRSKKTPE